jgi:CBS domain-containing protein
MTSKVQTVKAEEPLRRALEKMVKRNVGSIVVLEGERPVGIITERDVSRYVARGTNTLRTKVRKLMSSPLITIAPSAVVQQAMMMMLKHGIRRIPVVENGKMVGIISERDLLRWVVRSSYKPPPETQALLNSQPFLRKTSKPTKH